MMQFCSPTPPSKLCDPPRISLIHAAMVLGLASAATTAAQVTVTTTFAVSETRTTSAGGQLGWDVCPNGFVVGNDSATSYCDITTGIAPQASAHATATYAVGGGGGDVHAAVDIVTSCELTGVEFGGTSARGRAAGHAEIHFALSTWCRCVPSISSSISVTGDSPNRVADWHIDGSVVGFEDSYWSGPSPIPGPFNIGPGNHHLRVYGRATSEEDTGETSEPWSASATVHGSLTLTFTPLVAGCCLQNGSCMDATYTDCQAAGGYFTTSGLTCADGACRGACCQPDGTCVQLTGSECVAVGGTHYGRGTSCVGRNCGGACCFGDGQCRMLLSSPCNAQGGSYQGSGTNCVTNVCYGACCQPSGNCVNVSWQSCQAYQGNFIGFGSLCVDYGYLCVGACCLPSETCELKSYIQCENSGGAYFGDGYPCVDVSCICEPTVGSVTPRFVGTLLDIVLNSPEFLNNFEIYVDWGVCEPGHVTARFPLTDATVVIPASDTLVTGPIDMASVLEFGTSALANPMEIQATAASGSQGPVFESTYFGGQLAPSFMQGLAFEGLELKYQERPLKLVIDLKFENVVLEDFAYKLNVAREDDPTNLFQGVWGLTIKPPSFHCEYWVDPTRPTVGQLKVALGLGVGYEQTGMPKDLELVRFNAGGPIPLKSAGFFDISAGGSGSIYPTARLNEFYIATALAGTLETPAVYFPIGPTPPIFYFKATFEGGVSDLKVSWEDTATDQIPGTGLRFKPNPPPKFGVSAAGTVGVGTASKVGDYTLASVEGTLKTSWEHQPLAWWPIDLLNGNGGFAVDGSIKAKLLVFEKTLVEGHIFKATYHPWSVQWLTSLDAARSPWRLIDRSYIDQPAGYMTQARAPRDAAGPSVVLANIFPDTVPSLALDGAARWIALEFDDPELPQDQALEIGVVHDSGSGWQPLRQITTDVIIDAHPSLALDALGRPVVAWLRFPTLAPGDPVEIASRKGEIAFSMYDAGTDTWSTPSLITGNAYQDWPPTLVAGEDGSLTAFWLGSPTNSLPIDPVADAEFTSTLYSATWAGSGFSTPQAEMSGLHTDVIPSLHVDSASTVTAAWEEDIDGHRRTYADREILVARKQAGVWSTPTRLTTNTFIDGAPSIARTSSGELQALWVRKLSTGDPDFPHDELLSAVFTAGAWEPEAEVWAAPGIDAAELVSNTAGDIWLQWSAASRAGSSDLWASRHDSATGSWSRPIQLTSDSYVERASSAALDADGALNMAYTARAFSDPHPAQRGGIPTLGEANLMFLRATPTPNLTVGASDLEFAPASAQPGQSVNITVWLRNTGISPAVPATLQVFDVPGDGPPIELASFSAAGVLAGGGAAPFSLDWLLPTDRQTHTLRVVCDANGELAESDEDDNVLVLPILAPNWRAEIRHQGACDAAYADVELWVGNRGSARTPEVRVRLQRIDTGDTYFDMYVLAPDPGSSQFLGTAWSLPAGSYRFIIDPLHAAPDLDASDNQVVFRLPQTTPTIDQAPAGTVVYPGQMRTFSVDATGEPMLSYQWTHNGNPLPDAPQGRQLTIYGATQADAGLYAVVVTNACGSVTSSPAELVVTCVGDFDLNQAVNLADVSVLLATLGSQYGETYQSGDADGDGDVDIPDLALVQAHYGGDCP